MKKDKIVLPPIENNSELKRALQEYWQCQAQVDEALAEIKAEKAKIWAPVANLKDEAVALNNVIQAYMKSHDLHKLKCDGKIFTLNEKTTKAKAALQDIADMLLEQGIIGNGDFITNAKIEKIKSKIKIENESADFDDI